MLNQDLLPLANLDSPPADLDPHNLPALCSWLHKNLLKVPSLQKTSFEIIVKALIEKAYAHTNWSTPPSVEDITHHLQLNQDLIYTTSEYDVQVINLRRYNESNGKWESKKAFTRRIQAQQNVYDNIKRRWLLKDLTDKELPSIQAIKALQEESDALTEQLKVVKAKLAQAKKNERQRIKSEVTPLLKNKEGMEF